MTRAPAFIAAALLCALTGCGSDDTTEPTAAPTSAPAATSAAPSATLDKDRRGCKAISALGDINHDPTANRDAGALAAEAANPGIRQAGIDLVTAATRASADPGNETNLGLNSAQRAVAAACAAVFGDGPW